MSPLIFIAGLMATTPCRSSDLTEEQLDERIVAAEKILADHESNLMVWYASIFGVHSAVAAGALVIANASDDDGVKKEMYVATVGSVLGLITLAMAEPPLIGATQTVGTIVDKKARLSKLEAILERSAHKISRTQSWLNHGVSFLYSLGASLVLWFALDRKRAAITQFLGGQLIGQGRILLEPVGGRDAWYAYRAEYLAGCGEVAEVPAVRIAPAGLGIAVQF